MGLSHLSSCRLSSPTIVTAELYPNENGIFLLGGGAATKSRFIYYEEEVLYLRCIEKEFNAGQVQLASTGILFAELISFLVNRDGSSSNVVKIFCSLTLGFAPFLPQHYGTELDADISSRITELFR